MLSFIHEGQVLDWHFKTRDNVHYFYTGHIYQGQIHKINKSWDAVCDSLEVPRERRISVDGFRTRIDAASYLLHLKYHFPKKLAEWEAQEQRTRDVIAKYKDTK